MLRDALAAGKLDALRLREAHVAPLAGQPHAGTPVGARQPVAREQRREQRLARVRRVLAREPGRTHGLERRIADRAVLALEREARELEVVADDRADLAVEQLEAAPARERFQPLEAQAVGQRRSGIAGQVAQHGIGIGVVEADPQLPVLDIGREDVVLERRREGVEAAAVAAVEGVLGPQDVGVGLREGVGRAQGKRERREDGATFAHAGCGEQQGSHPRIVGERAVAHNAKRRAVRRG